MIEDNLTFVYDDTHAVKIFTKKVKCTCCGKIVEIPEHEKTEGFAIDGKFNWRKEMFKN